MTISTYISDLLYRYECVILPGFGAFLTQNLSARIDNDTNTFYPPSKIISFNRQLQTNDGLLANYVASAENISYEVALRQVRDYASTLLKRLEKGEVVTFKNIGEISKNTEGTLLFSPKENQNFNTSSFGLSPVISHLIEREIQETPAAEKQKDPIKRLPSHPERRSYLKYAAAAAIAVLAIGFGGVKFYENQQEQQNLAERQKATDLIENRIQEATFVIKNPLPPISLKISRQSGNYHLVAGAFREEENAGKKMDELRENGYSPRMLTSRYGLHQVLYQSFESQTEALLELRKIRNNENEHAWLLVQEID